MSPTKKIIIANWKANPTSLDQAKSLFEATVKAATQYPSVQTVVCPPFVYLEELSTWLKSQAGDKTVSLGVQDVWEAAGPFTGEISPEMVRGLGVQYVLVGHSDRRYKLGESDELINRKLKAALQAGITPVLLVGEKEAEDYRQDILIDQMARDLEGLNAEEVAKVLVAYEPVWAISTSANSRPDTPENTLEAIGMIKEILHKNWQLNADQLQILYGGSVNETNAVNFLSHPEIAGAVIGGASLKPEEFAHILQLVNNVQK
ncbi:MAG: triose-phosphate isomerase [bacterium]|nr:triose-phosphate isomerase [bacterium]